jgi:transcriptional regulator with XRE-family HTH domain
LPERYRDRIPSAVTPTEDIALLSSARRLARTGAAIRLRRAALLSQADVARACGVSPAAVCRWERGERQPKGEAARRYAELLRSLAKSQVRAMTSARQEDEDG